MIVKCQICGKEFKVKPSDLKRGYGKFCSRKCTNIAQKTKVVVVCEYCGKEFKTWPSQIKKGWGKYCSNKCSYLAQTTKITVKCQVCGKRFNTVPSELKKGWGKYCSRKCKGLAERVKILVICEYCGKEFETYPDQIKKGYGRYCSKKCKGAALSGPSCYMWRGGISFEPYTIEFNKALKRYIRERNNYTCQICGKEHSKDVHHINFDKKDCRKPNLTTLCHSCHSKTTNGNRDFWTGALFIENLLDKS